MDNFIVTESYSTIRRLTRERLSGSWGPVCLGVLVYCVLFMLVPQFFSDCTNIGVVEQAYEEYGQTVRVSAVASLYRVFFSGVFTYGIVAFILTFIRMKKTRYDLIMSGFEIFSRCFLLSIVMTVLVMLWSILFIIPGIIAAYRYSQAFYILVDDPTKGVFQCLRESKIMMFGNKAKLFWLELSFIGWMILAAIPAGLIDYFAAPAGGTPMEFLCFCISLLFEVPVMAYMMGASAVFYELVTNHLVRVSAPQENAGQDPFSM